MVALVLGLAVTDGGASSPWPEAELYSNAELDGFSSELRELLPHAPQLRVILMSATLDARLFCDYYGE